MASVSGVGGNRGQQQQQQWVGDGWHGLKPALRGSRDGIKSCTMAVAAPELGQGRKRIP